MSELSPALLEAISLINRAEIALAECKIFSRDMSPEERAAMAAYCREAVRLCQVAASLLDPPPPVEESGLRAVFG